MIRPISDKQLVKLQHDVEVKRLLIKRCGGHAVDISWHRGVLINVGCAGGRCEWCGGSASWLPITNHEIKFKSAGGKVTPDNSIMLCHTCHDLAQRHLISREELYEALLRKPVPGEEVHNNAVSCRARRSKAKSDIFKEE